MSKGKGLREKLDVLALVRNPAKPIAVNGELSAQIQKSRPHDCPPAALLEKRSDWTFVSLLVTEVEGYGLTRPESETVIAAVLGTPLITVAARTSSGAPRDYLMAVSFEGAVGIVTAAAVTLTVDSTSKPPQVIDKALQILGGRGYMRENPVERLYRDIRVDRIWEGTSEIQRVIVGGQIRKRGLGVYTEMA